MIYFLGYPNVRMKPETDIRTSPKPEQFPPPPTFLDGKGPNENRQIWNLSSYWKVDIFRKSHPASYIQASSYSVFEVTDGSPEPTLCIKWRCQVAE